jgi:hypothetical protein
VKAVLLTYLTFKPDDDYSSWANEVKKHFSGQVLIAKDRAEFCSADTHCGRTYDGLSEANPITLVWEDMMSFAGTQPIARTA